MASIAALVAAGLCFCGLEPAFAQGAADGKAAHFLMFAGIDVWRNGGFGHGGLLWSPEGLAQDGFTLKVLLGGGSYRYRSGATEITGRQYLAAIMPGWRFKRGTLEVTVYAGPDFQQHQLSPDDPASRLRGFNAGLRGGIDAWFEPVPAAMMVTASVSASTVGTNVWARAATGWRFFEAVWLGPEAQYCGDESYRQFRAGMHATALRTRAFEWSLGAGWVTDSDDRSGLYGRLGMVVRR